MDELGFNKIAAAVLATALGFMLIKEVSHSAMHISAPEKPVYPELAETAPTDVVVEELPFPQETWIAAMDAERGAKVFKKCTSCHNADAGGSHGTGPNLYDIVGVAAAQKAGFNYSGAITNSGIIWDYEALDEFLKKPSAYLSGVNMNFVGLKKEGDRAAVIEYLRVASDAPVDRPVAAVVDAPSDLIEEIAEDVQEDGETVVEVIEDVVDQAGDGAETVADAVSDVAEDALEAGEDIVEEVIEAGEDLVEEIKEDVAE